MSDKKKQDHPTEEKKQDFSDYTNNWLPGIEKRIDGSLRDLQYISAQTRTNPGQIAQIHMLLTDAKNKIRNLTRQWTENNP